MPAQLVLFLTRVLWDDSGLELFVSHGWQQVVGVQEVVYKELCWEFFLTIRFEKALMRWADRSMFTLRLGGVLRSCNLNELGRRLGIYTTEETMSPHFVHILIVVLLRHHRSTATCSSRFMLGRLMFPGRPRRAPFDLLYIG